MMCDLIFLYEKSSLIDHETTTEGILYRYAILLLSEHGFYMVYCNMKGQNHPEFRLSAGKSHLEGVYKHF